MTDSEEALRHLGARDPDLRKTLALAGAGNPPAPLRRWLADATRHLLADRLKGVSIDPLSPAHEQIGRIAAGLAPALRAKDRIARAAAESLLRLSIKLVTDARPDFSAPEMLALLFAPLREADADSRLALAELRGRVQEAGVAQLRDMSLVQAAALDQILGAERARSEAQDRANVLDTALAVERDRVRELREKLATAEAHAEALKADVARLNQAVADHRQIGAHGTAELLARMRALLAGRIDPLLADAADALEIEPPILEVVRDRIESGRGVIKGELRWLDESSD
ncbi:coiled-coil domain-containing protein [Roseococcus thiosulfatophilus]|uniref:hypothetical protein n=1 Tax=Roseococcus thiosulfatophilus TaxID=35813 RepID=UPI001A8E3BCD|nr:hypothetical protein [Roseococcus thiosulfatophilus]